MQKHTFVLTAVVFFASLGPGSAASYAATRHAKRHPVRSAPRAQEHLFARNASSAGGLKLGLAPVSARNSGNGGKVELRGGGSAQELLNSKNQLAQVDEATREGALKPYLLPMASNTGIHPF